MTDSRTPPTAERRLLGPLSTLGHADTDDARTRTRKTTLVLTATIAATLVLPWGMFYVAIGVPRAGFIPIGYAAISFFGVALLHRTKKDELLRYSQVALFLILPTLVHIALGGFVNSSGVVMYSFVGVVGALSFADAKRPGLWFATYAALVMLLIPLDETLRGWAPDFSDSLIIVFFAINMVTTSLIVFFSMIVYVRARDRLADDLDRERARSDAILRNVLPESIAERLKDGEKPIADRHDQVAVLFADIVDFTPQSERLSADELVDALNIVFSDFDGIALSRGVEKVKTVGDAYMVMAGAPDPGTDVNDLAEVALAMREAAHGRALGNGEALRMRFGMDVGPLVAGVIGESRFLYDVYGDTVNTASRMESNGVPDRIQITERVLERLDDRFVTSERGPIDIKGKGVITTHFLEGERRADPL